MSLYKIPAEVFRSLLVNIDGDISLASPFAFLASGEFSTSLEPHLDWLEKNGCLASETTEGEPVELVPALRTALDIVARPIRTITISEVTPQQMRRAVYASDGYEVTTAMFDEETCFVSDPVSLEAFHGELVEAIGMGADSEIEQPSFRIHPLVLQVLGMAAGPVGPEDEALSKPKTTRLGFPVARSKFEARLAGQLEDPQAASEFVDALIADEILTLKKTKLEIHPKFVPWYQAISSGDFFEIERLEFPDEQVQRALPPVQGLFLGEGEYRCVMWPVEPPSDEVVLARPTADELGEFVGYLVGYIPERVP